MGAAILNTPINAVINTTRIFAQVVGLGGPPGLNGANGTNGFLTVEPLTPVAGVATLAHTPLNDVAVFDGVPLIQGLDFTRVAAVITFLFPAQNPIAIYTH